MQHSELFGKALWIGATKDNGDKIFPLLRRDFEASGVKKATLTVIGFGTFECFLNGQRVHDDYYLPLVSDYEDRGYPAGEELGHRAYACRYDVTGYVADGRNALCLLLGNSWYNGAFDVAYGARKACFRLEIEDKNGKSEVLSDTATRWIPSFIKDSSLHFGEAHDYTTFRDEWMLPSSGMNGAEGWQNAVEAVPVDTFFDLSDCPTDRIVSETKPVLLKKEGNVALYDIGENISACPVLIPTTDAKQTVTVTCSEALDENGELAPRHAHGQKNTFTVADRDRKMYPRFTWMGARYLRVEGEAEVALVRKIHCDVKVSSSFECDNETLNWFYKTYLNTQLCNMHGGIPSDCPHLERRGYTGDGQLTCDTVMLLLDTKKFYEKWIVDIADCQDRKSGHVQYTAPACDCGGGPGGWGGAIVVVPYVFWQNYGDERFIRKMYPQMLHYFDYLDAHSENGLVTSDQPGKWCLGEWVTPGNVILPPPFVNNYFYVRLMGLVCEIAKQIGREEDIPALRERMEARKRTLHAAYYDSLRSNYVGNAQGANAFALDIGLGNEKTKKDFIEHYRAEPWFDTGIFGTAIIIRLLFEYGESETAVKILTASEPRGFGHWKEAGATTLWEYWDDFARSYSHPMFGAVASNLFTDVLGIRKTAPGFASVKIAPANVPQLGRARGSVETVKGRIAVSFEKDRATGKMTVTTEIPAGVPATVEWNGESRPLSDGKQVTVFDL